MNPATTGALPQPAKESNFLAALRTLFASYSWANRLRRECAAVTARGELLTSEVVRNIFRDVGPVTPDRK